GTGICAARLLQEALSTQRATASGARFDSDCREETASAGVYGTARGGSSLAQMCQAETSLAHILGTRTARPVGNCHEKRTLNFLLCGTFGHAGVSFGKRW